MIKDFIDYLLSDIDFFKLNWKDNNSLNIFIKIEHNIKSRTLSISKLLNKNILHPCAGMSIDFSKNTYSIYDGNPKNLNIPVEKYELEEIKLKLI